MPATTYWANSPSSVLQIHPRRDNFCSTPARVPSEYAQESENQVQRPAPAIASSMTIARKRPNLPDGRRWVSAGGTAIRVMSASLDSTTLSEPRLAAEMVGRGLIKNPRNPLIPIWYPKSKHSSCPGVALEGTAAGPEAQLQGRATIQGSRQTTKRPRFSHRIRRFESLTEWRARAIYNADWYLLLP